MFEVDSSKVAIGKAENQAVKEFAQKMIDDHSAANSKLATIAAEQKLKVPTALDAKHLSDLDALNKAPAPIDGQYVEMQQAAHADAVALFESYSQNGDNATLKTFATETLPTLKMHKDMVEKLEVDAPASGTTEATAVKTPVATVNPDPGAKGNLASNIIGETVYNSTAEEAEQIGEVNDIVMNANGAATLLIIGVGGFLGVGERDVAIDFNGAEWAEKDGDRWLVVATTKETLEGMEPFDRTPYVITPAAHRRPHGPGGASRSCGPGHTNCRGAKAVNPKTSPSGSDQAGLRVLGSCHGL